MIRRILAVVVLAAATVWIASGAPQNVEWSAYGGNHGGAKYSELRDISRDNVSRLRVAWTFRTGEADIVAADKRDSAFEATPLMVDGLLYVITPFNRVIALDPGTGAERWRFDPGVDLQKSYSEVTARGVATWVDRGAAAGAACRRRIVFGTLDARLFSVDAKTGARCAGFGTSGEVDLTQNVRVVSAGDYQVTSPPAVVKDLVVVGSSIGDNRAADLERGVVRAHDARTGALRWTWDPIPTDSNDPAARTWRDGSASRTGTANAWSIITADEARDLVFVPTSSPSPDFYGGMRLGDNRYANSVVALRASTGHVVWHFQVVHHDVWDYDVASQPVLAEITHRGTRVPVVLAGTKIGHLFVLHRETGEPIFPVEERKVPASDVAGEELSPTQPFPTQPKALVPQGLTAGQVWGATDADRAWCREEFARLRSDGLFAPPSERGTLLYPGNGGGMHWGGLAFDAARQRVVVNTNRLATIVRLIPREKAQDARSDPFNNRFGGEFAPQRGTPYAMFRHVFVTPGGIPCTPPPWGALSAVDLASGQVTWEVPLGGVSRIAAPGAETLGSPNLGGALVAGDLVFIAAAMDEVFRAFDIDSGREVWRATLPASAQASPMTYRFDGKQYVVIAAGGHGKLGTKMGDSVVAFALPGAPEAARYDER